MSLSSMASRQFWIGIALDCVVRVLDFVIRTFRIGIAAAEVDTWGQEMPGSNRGPYVAICIYIYIYR